MILSISDWDQCGMYQRGHLGMGLALYAPVGFFVAAVGGLEVGIIGAVVVGSLASTPDLDMRVPFIKHRGITHTVWFALVIGVVMAIVGGIVGLSMGPLWLFVFAILGGILGILTILSHIVADALTPMGVQPYKPVRSTKYTWDLVKASNPIANYGLLVIGGVLASAAVFGGYYLRSLVVGA